MQLHVVDTFLITRSASPTLRSISSFSSVFSGRTFPKSKDAGSTASRAPAEPSARRDGAGRSARPTAASADQTRIFNWTSRRGSARAPSSGAW